jgi:pyrroline-5-carboxylate reductase
MTARRDERRDMRVAIVGAGVMAEAMIAGLLADKAVAAARLVASHPRRDRRDLLTARHGITMVARNAEAVPGADIVVVAVKPQMLQSVMREVGPALEKGQVVLSIVAGATLRTLTAGLDHAAVVRAMPNTPCLIKEGMTAVAAGTHATEAHLQAARKMFDAIGRCIVVDEKHMDAVTALSASGPAFVYTIIESEFGHSIEYGVARLLPAAAPKAIARHLALAPGSMVLYLVQTDYSALDEPLLYSREYHLPDAFDFMVWRRGPNKLGTLVPSRPILQ